MKFRKKPVIIDAEQWFPGIQVDGVIWNNDIHNPEACIETLEGKYIVSPGDYIITGIKGERYPCKPDIFKLTYELVE